MNIKKLLSCALLGLPMLALARPASPEVMTITNPDGSIVNFRLHGNENFNYCTDPDNTIILEHNAEGYLKPAFRNGRMLTTNAADLNLLRSESLPLIQQRNEAINRMAQLDNQGRSTYTTVGEAPGLVILIEYADTPFSCENPLDQFTRLCNEPGYSDYGSVGSARDYYIDASNGLFRPTFDVYGPVKLSHPRAFYTRYGTDYYDKKNHNAFFGYAIQEAVKALDGQIDYTKYDVDENGIIDNIFFFFSGRGMNDTNDKSCIWPHQADFLRFTVEPEWGGIGLEPLVVDGVSVRTYACSCELNSNPKIPSDPWIDGIGAFVHEYGHVLGLPDLYDTKSEETGIYTETPGAFDVMDTGSYNLLSARPPMFSAYEKWLCNWLEYEDAVDNTTYTLPSISTGKDAKAVRIRTLKPGGKPTDECFIFESRTAEGWDESLSQNGILIWHINYDKKAWENNIVNINGLPNISIVRPEKDNDKFVVWPGDDNAFTYLTPETPDFKLVAYKYPNAFKPWISNISYDPETKCGTFEYNVYTEMPALTTVLHDSPTADTDTHSVTLKWDAAEGATDYLLTVQYKNALNKWATYDEYNNFSTKGATTETIAGMSDAYWETEFQAFVVPVKGYPSSLSSNTISFVPANLASKVEVIEADSAGIYGLNGRIEAPAGTRIFNLSGIETGTENLPAGIYIAVFEGKTAKVIVK